MSEKRTFGLVGFLLALLGGALILAASLRPFDRGFVSINLEALVWEAVYIILGIAVLFGSLMLYRRQYSSGGILLIILSIVVLIVGPYQVGAILALIGGVLGLVANEARG